MKPEKARNLLEPFLLAALEDYIEAKQELGANALSREYDRLDGATTKLAEAFLEAVDRAVEAKERSGEPNSGLDSRE